MVDTYAGTFASYGTFDAVVSATAQSEIMSGIDVLIALIPDPTDTSPSSAAHPDFDQIPPHTAQKLRDELLALKAWVDTAPTA